MTEFKIEKNIELPEKFQGNAKYPFGNMDVGDSFLVPEPLQKKVYAAASYYGSRNGKRFAVRRVADGVRCWRFE